MKSVLVKTAHYFWLTFAVLLVLAAVTVQLARELSPLLNSNKDYLAEQLAARLNSQVEIGSVQAHWQGLSASLRVFGLELLPKTSDSEESMPASLIIGEASVKVDWLRSLTEGRLVLADLTLSDTHAFLNQDQSGEWRLRGIATTAQGSSPQIDDPMDVFLFADRVTVLDVALHMENYSGRQMSFDFSSITFENDKLFHRMKGDVTLDGKPVVDFVMEAKGDPRAKGARDLKAYLSVHALPIKSLQDLLVSSGWNLQGDELESSQMSGQVWISSHELGRYQVNGRASVSLVDTNINGQLQLPNLLEARFFGDIVQAGPEPELSLQINDLNVAWPETQLSPIKLGVNYLSDQQAWQIKANRLDLAEVHQALQAMQLDTEVLNSVLADLDPRGAVSQIEAVIPRANPENFSAQATAEAITVSGWGGVPALRSVDGFVHVEAYEGYVLLKDDEFGAQFPRVLSGPLNYDFVRGSVSWHLQPENNAVYVLSNQLQLNNGDNHAKVQFRLYTPWEDGTAPTDLSLVVGMINASADERHPYLPQSLEPELADWLATSIHQAHIPQAGLVLRGRFSGPDVDSVAQLWLDVDDAAVDYHEDWPALEGVAGRLIINNGEARVNVQQAQFWDTTIDATQVVVADQGNGVALQLDGRFQAPGNDVLRLVRESTLGESVREAIDGWQLSSTVNGSVAFTVSLEDDSDVQDYQHLQIDIEPGTLRVPDQELELRELSGRFSYDSFDGLVSDGLSAELWGQTIKATVASPKVTDDKFKPQRDILASLHGSVDLAQLRDWLSASDLAPIDGVVQFAGNVMAPANSDGPLALINIDSNLQGARINLPNPLHKTADQILPFSLQAPIFDDHAEIQISLNKTHHAQINFRDGSVSAVGVGLAEKPTMAADKILVRGALDDVYADEWLEIAEFYQSQDLQSDDATAISTDVDILLKRLFVEDWSTDDVQVTVQQLAEDWQVAVDSEIVRGQLDIPSTPEQPMVAVVDYLRLPGDDEPEPDIEEAEQDDINAVPSPDPLADFDLTNLPKLNASIGEVLVGEESYGNWQFNLQPMANGVVVSDLIGSVRGLNITGRTENTGARLEWHKQNNSHFSSFEGRFSAEKLHWVLKRFDQPPLIEASEAQFDLALGWAGSPAAVNYRNFNGEIEVDIEHGRFKQGVEGGGDALLRLVALFNFDSWARRLRLGAADLVDSGLTFDNIDGTLYFQDQTILMPEPIKVKAPSSAFQYAGVIDLANEQLDTKLVATLPVGGNLTLVAALAAGLPAAAGVWAASKLFKKQVSQVASVSYRISGSWQEPELKFVKLFDDNPIENSIDSTGQTIESVTLPSSEGKPPSQSSQSQSSFKSQNSTEQTSPEINTSESASPEEQVPQPLEPGQ